MAKIKKSITLSPKSHSKICRLAEERDTTFSDALNSYISESESKVQPATIVNLQNILNELKNELSPEIYSKLQEGVNSLWP